MADEHFGISIVEYMAAGIVSIGEDSICFILNEYFSLDRCQFFKFGKLGFVTMLALMNTYVSLICAAHYSGGPGFTRAFRNIVES